MAMESIQIQTKVSWLPFYGHKDITGSIRKWRKCLLWNSSQGRSVRGVCVWRWGGRRGCALAIRTDTF